MLELSRIPLVVRDTALKARALLGLSKAEESAPAEQSATPRRTLFDLAREAETLMAVEVQSGCFGDVERQVAALGRAILDDQFDCTEGAQSDAPERAWVNLLRLGLFEELRDLVARQGFPLPEDVRGFLDFCAYEYALCRQRGEAYRARNPDEDIFTLGCIVWGEEYVRNFLRYSVRSMMSENNLPALRSQGRLVFSIVTDAAGEAQIRRDPAFAQLTSLGDVVFITMPEVITTTLRSGHLVRNFYILYGMLDHCSIYFAQGAFSHLYMIPVDAIVADGSLTNMASYRLEGFECCGGGNIVANTETFLPALEERCGHDGPITLTTEELASLAVQHAHHYFLSQIIAEENRDFGKHPRELFWPAEGGVEIHSVFIHPLFTSASGLAKYSRKHFANIDYGMIPRMFSGAGPIKIIDDPRKAYVNNYTAANRLYETTGRPFAPEDFMRSHDWSYPVQKALFPRAQKLPCRLEGWTPYRDVAKDVDEISLEFAEEEPRTELPATKLTIILPTRNRSALCRAQVRFLRRTRFRHRIIVADSSDQPDPDLKRVCRGLVEYRQFDAETPPGEKIAAVARTVETPYVAMITDDDISFPHTIDACLAFLEENPDYVVAQGYVLDAHMSKERIDVESVQWFTQGTTEETALWRLYELMRRYQPFFWAVLRTDAYARALDAANHAEGEFFKELAFTAAIAVLGKSTRLPMIHTLRGKEQSQTRAARGHPFYWFLSETSSFFDGYLHYRNRLAKLVEEVQACEAQAAVASPAPNTRKPAADLVQTLDIIHASYFGREMDSGMINHTARVLLGDPLKPLKRPAPPRHDEEIHPEDLVHAAGVEGRRYVWRREVLNAEPRSEIQIDGDEIARVEGVLDSYVPPEPGEAPIVSVFEPVDLAVVKGVETQLVSVENATMVGDKEQGFRFAETKRYGFHRLAIRVEPPQPAATSTWSLKVMADGCPWLRFEVHDDGARKYGMCVFDLATGDKVEQNGGLERAESTLLPDGYLQITIVLPSTVDSQAHLSMMLLDADHAHLHAGDDERAVLISEIAFT